MSPLFWKQDFACFALPYHVISSIQVYTACLDVPKREISVFLLFLLPLHGPHHTSTPVLRGVMASMPNAERSPPLAL